MRSRVAARLSTAFAMVAVLVTSGCTWIDRLSVDSSGGDPNGPSTAVRAAISADGRFVVFESNASDLVPGDGNGTTDVFRRDLQTGATVRASVDTSGSDPDGASFASSVSADGRYVAFHSAASDLVPGDTNARLDVFRRDLQTGTTTQVSVDMSAGNANGDSYSASISGTGRYIAFGSRASDLVPGDSNLNQDVFRRDLQTGTTVRVSVSTTGGDPDDLPSSAGSSGASINADGRYVAFDSDANNLVLDDDMNYGSDVFVRDVQAGTTVRASSDSTGADGDGASATISADGRYVVFESTADDLVPGDGNGTYDIFLRDLQAATPTRVSVDTTGSDPNDESRTASVSADGRYVTFTSWASDLVPGDGNGLNDAFVRDRELGRTIRVSEDILHGEANGASSASAISADGRYAVFNSSATNLVGNDGNGLLDAFVKYARVVTVDSITPNSVARGAANIPVVITGTGFESGSSVQVSSPDSAVSVSNVTVVDDGEIQASISVPPDSSVGAYDVLVFHPPTVLGVAIAAGQCSGCLQVVKDPNIVFVLNDDLRPDEMERVADLKPNGGFDWVRDHGVQFDKYISTDNLCCPGRATALTGRTAYNHKVFSNNERGTPVADLQSNSLPVWMQDDDYCTGFTGKYHLQNPRTRPAGWTYWEALAGEMSDEYGYKLMRRSGTLWKPGVFITDRIAAVSRAQVTDCLDGGKPVLAALWPVAPHFGSDPEPDYAATPIPWSNDDPSFNETDISDKPPWLQAWYPTPLANAESYYSSRSATRVRSLLSVDDALRSIINTLNARGELSNTVFVLTGDNGWLMGEHRVNRRKRLAYEAAQTGLWIAGPGFPAGTTSDAFATNLDIVPTIVKASGRVPPTITDGRALQDVLNEPDRGHDRFLPIYVPVETADVALQPVGDAVRTWRYKYVRYADGSEELYDLFADPYEESNLANVGGLVLYLKVAMQNLLETARACSGETCRASAPAELRG